MAAARADADDSKRQLAAVRREVEELLRADLGQLISGGGPHGAHGPQHHGGAPAPPASVAQELRELSAREARLSHEIRGRKEELALQAQMVAPRLAPDVRTRLGALVARQAELRGQVGEAEARWERDGSGAQALSRAQRELAAVDADVAACYRTGMTPEMRSRERALRSELQDRETELKSVVVELARVNSAARRASGGAKGGASGSGGGLADQVRTVMRALVAEREREVAARADATAHARERDLQRQLADREAALQREAAARVADAEQRAQRQVAAAQEALAARVREAEGAWRQQLQAAQVAAQQASSDRQALAAEATMTAAQARQQLLELQALREELGARSRELEGVRRLYGESKVRLGLAMVAGASRGLWGWVVVDVSEEYMPTACCATAVAVMDL